MAQPGLAERLRRHSRNSGMMVGISMAIAIVICIAAFIWIYVQIQPFFSDFIPRTEPAEDSPATTGLVGQTENPTPTTEPVNDDVETPEPVPSPTALPTPETSDDDVAASEWEPTHQIRSGPNVNFRAGPNTISQAQGALPPGTPLRFLDEEQPAGGVIWMFFDIEDGTEGWIRDIDVEEYQ